MSHNQKEWPSERSSQDKREFIPKMSYHANEFQTRTQLLGNEFNKFEYIT